AEQQVVGTSLGSDFQATLGSAGVYTLVVAGNASNSSAPVSYSFQVLMPSVSTQTLTLGNTVSGALTTPGDVNTYTFHGDVSQLLFLDGLSADNNLNIAVTGPSGETVLGNNFTPASFDYGPVT